MMTCHWGWFCGNEEMSVEIVTDDDKLAARIEQTYKDAISTIICTSYPLWHLCVSNYAYGHGAINNKSTLLDFTHVCKNGYAV